jgi:MFS transporter, DHA1 family, multidrug resistance protein
LDRGRRNFHAVWPSLFATSMGLMAFLPMLPLYVQERFGIEDAAELLFWAGVIYGAAPLSAAVAGPVWGAMGDRIGKKPMAIRANFAIAVTTALMPLAPSPGWLLAMRALQGLLAGYVAPAMALVSQAAPRERHGQVIANLQVAMATGSFLGPYLGAEVAHWFGRSSLFWIASALSALSALSLHCFAREDEVPAPDPRSGFAADFGRACGRLFHNGVFARLLVLVLVLRLGQNMLEPVLALFVRELGPLPLVVAHSATAGLALDRTTAIAFAMLAVAQWLCTRWWGRQADRFGPLRCLALLSLGLGALQLAMAMVATIGQFLLLRAAIACLMAGSLTLAYAAASKRVEDRDRTLAFALVQSCIQFGLALGPQLGTLVASRADGQGPDFAAAWCAAAALCAAAGAGMLWLRRRPAGSGRAPV